jgi:hypothetical protein
MSREHFDQRVVDDFERDLREALAIEPSPDFARQVRARIAARRAPVMWWRFALPIAATCVLAVGLMIWMNLEKNVRLKPDATVKASTVKASSTEKAASAGNASVAPEGSNVDPVASGFSRTLSRRAAPERRTTTTRRVTVEPERPLAPEPEIIVPPDRALALARLLELARNGSLNEEKLKPVASARPPATLDVTPLVVAPLSVPELETPSGAAQGGADRE